MLLFNVYKATMYVLEIPRMEIRKNKILLHKLPLTNTANTIYLQDSYMLTE